MKLADICSLRIGDENADFWIVRRGARGKVGSPTRIFNREHIGLKVLVKDVDERYLFWVFEHLWTRGVFLLIAHGTTDLVNIRIEDLKNIPLKRLI